MTLILDSLENVQATAREFIRQTKESKVFAFFGAMGVGKTTFITAICRELGVTDTINSPTFAIVNEYETPAGETVYHFDFYRINSPEEAFDLGYEDYFYRDGTRCFVEWSEKIEALLPPDCVRVEITEEAGGARSIKF